MKLSRRTQRFLQATRLQSPLGRQDRGSRSPAMRAFELDTMIANQRDVLKTWKRVGGPVAAREARKLGMLKQARRLYD